MSTWPDFLERNKPRFETDWEWRFARHILPATSADPDSTFSQYVIRERSGRKRKIDFAILEGPFLKIAIEIDGWDKTGSGGGATKDAWENEKVRQNELTGLGFTFLRFSNRQIHRDPEGCRRQLEDALSSVRAKFQTASAPHEMVTRFEALLGESESLFLPRTAKNPRRRWFLTMAGATAFVFVAVLGISAMAKKRIPSIHAAEHIGERAVVCGLVADARWDADANDRPTYLNFDRAYPDQTFTAVISFPTRKQLRDSIGDWPDRYYEGREVCVEGVVLEGRGKPRIKVSKLSAIRPR